MRRESRPRPAPSTLPDGYLSLCRWQNSTPPTGDLTPAEWDLRGREHQFLGRVNVADQRVAILGGSDGHLVWWCESRGAADVVVTVWPLGRAHDLFPCVHVDERAVRSRERSTDAALRRTFWLMHDKTSSASTVLGADPYECGLEGCHDVVVIAWPLDSLADPFHALSVAAAATQRTVIVPLQIRYRDVLPVTLARWTGRRSRKATFLPRAAARGAHQWWALRPGIIEEVLELLGFRVERRVHAWPRYRDRPQLVCSIVATREETPG